jgi:hypothetical protein
MAEPTLQKLKSPGKVTKLFVVEVINILQVPVQRVKESYPSTNIVSKRLVRSDRWWCLGIIKGQDALPARSGSSPNFPASMADLISLFRPL